MKILEIMERANVRDTNLAIAYIRDAMHEMQSTTDVEVTTETANIVDGTRDYPLPLTMVSLMSVSVLNENTDIYERIPRIVGEPIIQSDESP